MHQALEGLRGTTVIADDILVYGEGDTKEAAEKDHENNLRRLLERCREKNIKLNEKKLKLRQTELRYIGHVLTDNGTKPDPDKI